MSVQEILGEKNDNLQPGICFSMGHDEIMWCVLDVNKATHTLTAISQLAVCKKPYNSVWEDTTWQECSLRQWLNTEFITESFTDFERSVMVPDELGDRVSLLSRDDVQHYQSVLTAQKDSTSGTMLWLRTGGILKNRAAVLSSSGTVFEYGYRVSDPCAVRPVIRLSLDAPSANIPSPEKTSKPERVSEPLNPPQPQNGKSDKTSGTTRSVVTLKESESDCLRAISRITDAGMNPRPKDVANELGCTKQQANELIVALLQKSMVYITPRGVVQLTSESKAWLSAAAKKPFITDNLVHSAAEDHAPTPQTALEADFEKESTAKMPSAVQDIPSKELDLLYLKTIQAFHYRIQAVHVAARLGITKGEASAYIARLKLIGFVEDNHSAYITLTEKGKAFLSEADTARPAALTQHSDEEKHEAPASSEQSDATKSEANILPERTSAEPSVSPEISADTESPLPVSDAPSDVLPSAPDSITRYTLTDLISVSGTMIPVSYTDSSADLKQEVSSWEELYTGLCTKMCNNDPDGFSTLAHLLKNSLCPIQEYRDGHFRQPKQIADRFILETDGTPDKLLRKLRSMVLLLNKDPNRIEIMCRTEDSAAQPPEATLSTSSAGPATEPAVQEEFPSDASENTDTDSAPEISSSKIKYLKAIDQQIKDKGYVRAIDLSKALGYSKPSVSIALKELREAGLIITDTNNFISITAAGRSALAAGILYESTHTVLDSKLRYLQAISQCLEETGYVRAIDISRKLGYSKPSVSIALKKLADSGLISANSNNFLSLTDAGKTALESGTSPDSAPVSSSISTSIPQKSAENTSFTLSSALNSEKDYPEASPESVVEEKHPNTVSEQEPVPAPALSDFDTQVLSAVDQCAKKSVTGQVCSSDIMRMLKTSLPTILTSLQALRRAELVKGSDFDHSISLTDGGRVALQTVSSAPSAPVKDAYFDCLKAIEQIQRTVYAPHIKDIIDEMHEGRQHITALISEMSLKNLVSISPRGVIRITASGMNYLQRYISLPKSSDSHAHTETPIEDPAIRPSPEDDTEPHIEEPIPSSVGTTQAAPAVTPDQGSTGHYPAETYERISAYRGKEKYIFISYSHKNQTQVEGLIADMQKHGYHVWFDEGIKPGIKWDDDIAEHIRDCACMIAMLSEEYMQSENCLDELDLARHLRKKLLLVYLCPVQLPLGMFMHFNRLQAIHRYKETEQSFFQKLFIDSGLSEIKTLKDITQPSARSEQSTLKPPARTWIIPCNPNYYDVDGAFRNLPVVTWRQNFRALVGDTVFIYVSAPVQALCYECRIVTADLKAIRVDDSAYYRTSSSEMNASVYTWMELKLIRTLDPADTGSAVLQRYGIKGRIMGPRQASPALMEYLKAL